jgi:hypothetical protein
MNKALRFLLTLLSLLLLALSTMFNWRLYYNPQLTVKDRDTVNYDALCQLRYLRDALERGADVEMQGWYPEGYMFFNTMYGLGWCDFAAPLDRRSILYEEAHVELQRAFNNLNSEAGRDVFDQSLSLPYGAFYNGWFSYLLGKKLSIELPQKRDSAEVRLFLTHCEKISKAIKINPFPESYYGSSWPIDAVLCVAALALHDRIFEPTYKPVIERWWQKVHLHLDPSGLIPHKVNPITGVPVENARGSSQSLMQCFLPEIANDEHGFEIYRRLFLEDVAGLYGVREYPKGVAGDGDIDSGPIIFSMGGAATIVGIRAMYMSEDFDNYQALRNSSEALAFPRTNEGRKKYLFGKLPIVDAFMAWVSVCPGSSSGNLKTNAPWRTKFQIISALVSLPLLLALFFMWRKDIRIQKLWQFDFSWRKYLPGSKKKSSHARR